MKKVSLVIFVSCIFVSCALSFTAIAVAQENKFAAILGGGTISGGVQIDAQVYQKDTAIGAQDVDEKFRTNSFANIQYINGGFSAGMRIEAYIPQMLGYDARYSAKKAGIANYFARYGNDFVDVTAGTFYEQFGSGLILRSYQDWNLGMDNSILGARAVVTPYSGITLKGIVGTERYFWEYKGMVRGGDMELSLNDMITPMQDMNTRITLGGSFVSKYQKSEDVYRVDTSGNVNVLNLPANVASFATRLNIESGGFTFSGEYARKVNDPSAENSWTYNPGQALLFNVGYSMKGFGILLSAKSIDNMGYRLDRNELGQFGMINYMPALTRQHVYTLPSLYPYATQPNGEVGFQIDAQWKTGKKGPSFHLNASYTGGLKKTITDDLTYKATPFGLDSNIYFVDINFDVSHKFNKNWKATLMYMYEIFNQEISGTHYGEGKTINAHIVVGEVTYSFLKKHALRLEAQYMHTRGGEGEWLMGTLEYTFAPKWFFSLSDQFNFKNPSREKPLHYYYATVAFVHDATRIALSYGRVRQGVVCAGGVCRELPASNGLMLTLTTNF
ncbi:MAG: DUF6029 family protein [Bacteroidales bacterium]|jgi:hypothetical protein|nr:DUF6029 family protein [Bacteroidales bacterium]